ncbi:hypothetical protein [Sediminibacillus halophilus]|uniref:ABC-2 type transport system permease protein n=1 Tax=Sediminibacillus halophilus TaxID=482461 RepID=A0A1G9NUZ6_9BACI|nr:hypothetical protein [Sediminibacillus halophilus]SDL90219.1 hypothetical protein SAMN05216244_1164 [Sediminibacillus halophilus]
MRKRLVFTRLLYRDIAYSFSYSKIKYGIFFILTALLAAGKALQLQGIDSAGSVDVLYFMLKDEGYFLNLDNYQVPVDWIFFQTVALFLLSDYYVHDLGRNALYVTIRSSSKTTFLLAKLFWLILQTTGLFVGLFLVVFCVTGLVLGHFSLEVTPFYQHHIMPMLQLDRSPLQLMAQLLIGYIVTTLVLSMIQLLLVQFLDPVVLFLIVVLLLGISTIGDSRWLPAIHSMILRQEIFDLEHALSWQFSYLYSAALFIVLSIAALLVYRRKDIL